MGPLPNVKRSSFVYQELSFLDRVPRSSRFAFDAELFISTMSDSQILDPNESTPHPHRHPPSHLNTPPPRHTPNLPLLLPNGRNHNALHRLPRPPLRPLRHIRILHLIPLRNPHLPRPSLSPLPFLRRRPPPLMPKHRQLPRRRLRIQHLPHGIDRAHAPIRTPHQHRVVEVARGEADAVGGHAGDVDGREEAADGPRFEAVVVVGREEGVAGLGEADRGGGVPHAEGEDVVGLRVQEGGQAQVAGGGGGGKEVRGEGVGGAEGEDVGCLEGGVEEGGWGVGLALGVGVGG